MIQTKRKSKKCSAAADSANVDEGARDEPHDPDSEPGANPQDHNDQDKRSQDADKPVPSPAWHKTNWKANWSQESTSLFKQPTRQMTCRHNHVVNPQTEQDLLETSENDCQA